MVRETMLRGESGRRAWGGAGMGRKPRVEWDGEKDSGWNGMGRRAWDGEGKEEGPGWSGIREKGLRRSRT